MALIPGEIGLQGRVHVRVRIDLHPLLNEHWSGDALRPRAQTHHDAGSVGLNFQNQHASRDIGFTLPLELPKSVVLPAARCLP